MAGRSLANLAACLTMAALVLRTVSIRDLDEVRIRIVPLAHAAFT